MCSYPEATFCSTQTFGTEEGPGLCVAVVVVAVIVVAVIVAVVIVVVVVVARVS